MKKELKIGDSQKIVILESGGVNVPNEVRMGIVEIAHLFDISYPTIKKNIRTIEKLAIASGDYTMSCTVEGQTIYPDYYGLEMTIALSFRIKSRNAEIFRQWLVKKMMSQDIQSMLVLPLQNAVWN